MNNRVTTILLSVFLISLPLLTFNTRLLLPGSEQIDMNDVNTLNPSTSQSKIVRVVEREIALSEMQKMKEKFGVWKENRNYNVVLQGHGTGLGPPTSEAWEDIALNGRMVENVLWLDDQLAEPPAEVDLTETPWFPPIGNQDGEGSCVAWAVGYYTKTFQEAKEHGWNLSEAAWEGGYHGYPTPAYQDKIISPDFIYHLVNGGIDQGSSFYESINLVRGIGASSWEKMPYDPNDHSSWPSEEAWKEAPLYRGNSSGTEYLDLSTDEQLLSLKNWIVAQNLAVIAVDADQYSSLTSDDVWTLDNYVSPSENHANTIVGYDDNIEYVEDGESRHGAFKIANSWGKGGWESVADGCYWISYEAMKQRVEYCMFYGDRISYEPEILSSFRIDHSKRGECSISIGVGSHDNPNATKSFSNLIDEGDFPFCPNNIVFDITEFKEKIQTTFNQTFFIRVRDGDTATTGTIMNFSIQNVVSEDVPVATINGVYVYADVVMSNMIRVPSDYATIQEAINAATPGTTIEVASGIYFENIVVNKSVSLVGENAETTTIDGGDAANVTIITADNVTIRGFTIRNGDNSLVLNHVSNCEILENKISDCQIGVILHQSSNNLLRDNVIADNVHGFGVDGWELSHFVNDVDASNTVNGKSIVYLVNKQNRIIDMHAYSSIGYIGIVNCENVTVQHVDVKDSCQGILLAYTQNSLVQNVSVQNNVFGVELCYSSNSIIKESNITHNDVGAKLYHSSNNSVFHNIFASNQQHVSIVESHGNSWDKEYPEGGNFWSTYVGIDENNGPNQDRLGSDGIGDAPYVIDEYNRDHYPFMNPCDKDLIPPISNNDYDGLWHATNCTITLAATDVWGEVAETYYKTNNGSIKTLGADGQPCITTEGADNSLEYWSVDNEGNEEHPHKILLGIKVDNTAPIGSITINDGNAYTASNSVVLTLTAVDAASGVFKVRYSNDGVWDTEQWQDPSATITWNLIVGDGPKTVYYQIKDRAELVSETYSDTIVLDSIEPIIETPIRKPANEVQPYQPVEIFVNITDIGSGVENVTLYYTINNGTSWASLPMSKNSSTNAYEVVIPGQPGKTWVKYCIAAYDYAGNEVSLDETEPYWVSEVVYEYSSIFLILLLIILTVLAVALAKGRKQLKD